MNFGETLLQQMKNDFSFISPQEDNIKCSCFAYSISVLKRHIAGDIVTILTLFQHLWACNTAVRLMTDLCDRCVTYGANTLLNE